MMSLTHFHTNCMSEIVLTGCSKKRNGDSVLDNPVYHRQVTSYHDLLSNLCAFYFCVVSRPSSIRRELLCRRVVFLRSGLFQEIHRRLLPGEAGPAEALLDEKVADVLQEPEGPSDGERGRVAVKVLPNRTL